MTLSGTWNHYIAEPYTSLMSTAQAACHTPGRAAKPDDFALPFQAILSYSSGLHSCYPGKNGPMNIPPVSVERRVGQRFPYSLAVSVFEPSSSLKGVGFTQDLSSRGAFFFTEVPLAQGSEVELTLQMPSEITLGESMPVRCRARVLRVVTPSGAGAAGVDGRKIGVAVRLEHYEYLAAQPEFATAHTRVSSVQSEHEDADSSHSAVRFHS